ncbi:MAG: DUF2490 domain-containing protein [Bacteroidota bacterium]
MKKQHYLLVVALFVCQTFFAQTKTTNENSWLHYVGKNRLSEKLSFTLEATMRYTNGFNEKQQYFIRPSIDYQLTKDFNGSIGYSHYETYVYGSAPMNKINTPEDHVWIQGTYTKSCGNYKFTHRLRDEFRWVGIATKNVEGNLEINKYDYRNRLRYHFLMNYTLTKKEDKVKLFALIGDEVFVNVGVKNAKTLLQQNRVMAGLGYNINTCHQIQLSYIHQNIWNLNNTLRENNPTLRLSYIATVDWFKKSE